MTTIMKGSCCTGQYIVSCEARGTVSCQHGDTIYTNKRGSKKILGFLFSEACHKDNIHLSASAITTLASINLH